jgi:hypothetical protein
MFQDTPEQLKAAQRTAKRYNEPMQAPRDVMPGEDMPSPKRMRMPPKEVKSKVPVKKMMGGNIKGYAKGGKIDGCAQRGKTRGKVV